MNATEISQQVAWARESVAKGEVHPDYMREVVAILSDRLDEAVRLLESCNFSQKWAEDREAFLAKVRR